MRPPRLLITDDNRDLRETLRTAFGARGLVASVASDGYETLAIAQSQAVHLLLMDFQMPGLNGLETVRRLGEHRIRLPWVLVSGAIDDTILAEAQQLQVRAVITKPVRFKDAASRIFELLREIYGWEPLGS